MIPHVSALFVLSMHWQPSRIAALPYAPIMPSSSGSDSAKYVLATSAALPNL